MSRSATRSPSPEDATRKAVAVNAPSAQREWLGVAVVVVATVVTYANSLRASFQFDDFPVIVWNERLRALGNLWPPAGNRWVGDISFALNYRVGGLEVIGYHLVNVAVHAGNGLLVYALASTTLRLLALRDAHAGPLVRTYLPIVAGTLFSVHPVATEAVTYVVQRYTSLATLFFVSSLVLYVRARLALETAGRPTRSAVVAYVLSVAAAVAAMKTKEIAFTLPVVAGAFELLFFRRGRWQWLVVPLGAAALLIPAGLATGQDTVLDVIGNAERFAAEIQGVSRWTYALTQTRVVATYLRLLLFPVGQNLDYDFALSHSMAEPVVLIAAAIIVAVVAGAAIVFVRSRRVGSAEGQLLFLGVAWFFITLTVESSVIPIRDVIFEHRIYLPSVGAAIAAGTLLLSGVERLGVRAVSLAAQAAAVLLLTAGPLGIATYRRNLVWKDPITLWSDVVTKSPGKRRPHYYLALHLASAGRLDDAIREYGETLRLAPGYAPAHTDLGRALFAKGLLDDAIREYRTAIRLDPSRGDTYVALGEALARGGQLEEAIQAYREAVRIEPSSAKAHSDLGVLCLSTGRIDDAVREHREAVRVAPALAKARANLGAALLQKGDLVGAAGAYAEAVRLDPLDAQSHFGLGFVLVAQGRPADAIAHYTRAVELAPTPEAVLNLASALDDAGRTPASIVQFQRFLDLAGDRYPEHVTQVKARLEQLQRDVQTSSPKR